MAMVRLALGLLQMAGAAFFLALLIWTGMNRFSMTSVAITSLLTLLSISLYGSRSTSSLPSRTKERN